MDFETLIPNNGNGCIPSDERKYQIQHLWERHHEILNLALRGLKHREIAEELGVTTATVSNCVNSAIGRKMLGEMRAAVDKEAVDTYSELRKMNVKSVAILESILDAEEAPMALKAKVAMDNLSRTGFAPQVNVRGVFEHRHLTAEDIERIKNLAVEAASRNGNPMLLTSQGDAEIVSPSIDAEIVSPSDFRVCQDAEIAGDSISTNSTIDVVDVERAPTPTDSF